VITRVLSLKAKVPGQFDTQFWVERESLRPNSFLINGSLTPLKYADLSDVKLVICRWDFRKFDASASNRLVRYLSSYILI
jgi:hypothetical protein